MSQRVARMRARRRAQLRSRRDDRLRDIRGGVRVVPDIAALIRATCLQEKSPSGDVLVFRDYFCFGAQTTLQELKSHRTACERRQAFVLRNGVKVPALTSSSLQFPNSVQIPLELKKVHVQCLAAFAGLLPTITTGTATSAPINVRCSNRIVASYVVCLAKIRVMLHDNTRATCDAVHVLAHRSLSAT